MHAHTYNTHIQADAQTYIQAHARTHTHTLHIKYYVKKNRYGLKDDVSGYGEGVDVDSVIVIS